MTSWRIGLYIYGLQNIIVFFSVCCRCPGRNPLKKTKGKAEELAMMTSIMRQRHVTLDFGQLATGFRHGEGYVIWLRQLDWFMEDYWASFCR